MRLLWKLLRQHVSLPQLVGFVLANLAGMWIVMLGVQFYGDLAPMFSRDDGFFGADYLVVSKRISTVTTLSGASQDFTDDEVDELGAQPFAKGVGRFTSSQYKVTATMGVKGSAGFASELFFEAVPDSFVEVSPADWQYEDGARTIPVILPRTYLALYNFGFAASRGLPKVSDAMASQIEMRILIHATGRTETFSGRVIGFSSRLNTILVPRRFLEWSNNAYEPGKDESASRLIVRVDNPADEGIMKFMQERGYEVEDNRLDAGKATFFLRIVVTLVTGVGLLVCLLSFYILMLSVFLLVQKNTQKLQNLLLIGYSPARVSLPYQLLTLGLNVAVFLLAALLLLPVRSWYMHTLAMVFPQVHGGTVVPALLVGLAILLLVTIFNSLAIRRKVEALKRG
ncbi:MAG: ABC transporter permease [Bacteroidaceae bacterium]|nr:ABC transporter permease [Bacteroidaceae bacterium]